MILSFYDWLVGNLGKPGEYQFKKIYWITLIFVLLFVALYAVLGANKKISDKNKRKILVVTAIFQLSFELLWRVIFFFVKKSPINQLWPMYPCNLGGIIIPIIALCNWKKGKRIFYLFAFLGACLTFAFPEGIFCSDVMVFPILKSVLQHTGILMIPVFEYSSNSFKSSIKDYAYTILGCYIHLINCEIIDRLFGLKGDYMFFKSGLPFVIKGVPQFITLTIFGLIVIFIFSYISDIKTSNQFILETKEKIINKNHRQEAKV